MSRSPLVVPTGQRNGGTMDMKRRETGIIGEKLACDFLGKNGYQIMETNYRCPDGEIDIIAMQEAE